MKYKICLVNKVSMRNFHMSNATHAMDSFLYMYDDMYYSHKRKRCKMISRDWVDYVIRSLGGTTNYEREPRALTEISLTPFKEVIPGTAFRRSLYTTFAEVLYDEKRDRFSNCGWLYLNRKCRKKYTRKFLKHYAEGWGHPLNEQV